VGGDLTRTRYGGKAERDNRKDVETGPAAFERKGNHNVNDRQRTGFYLWRSICYTAIRPARKKKNLGKQIPPSETVMTIERNSCRRGIPRR